MNIEGKSSILIVDDDKANIIALTHILAPEYTIYAAKDGHEALEATREHLPDVILLDILMPEMNGFEVLSSLKSDEKTRAIPVIFITGLGDVENEEKGLSLGAADYMTKPFSPAIVRLRVKNQIQILNQIDLIRSISVTDPLTGLSNRRDFDYRMHLEWEHALRNKTPLSIFMIDVDNFKEYNDTHGHLQGDAALKSVAKAIGKSFYRSVDFAARWGGEEFAVLLPNTDLPGAITVAESIRQNVEAKKLTVSIGVATHMPDHTDLISDFINIADRALYNAKKTGKNKVCTI
jgi:diguanylate cyclase (GGDEF)-like protein